MNRIKVNTKNRDYEIIITDSFEALNLEIDSLRRGYSKVAILADDNVGPIYLETIEENIKKSYKDVYTYTFKNGEENKNLDTISSFYEFLIANEFDRKSLLIAVGGGVTGDMVGYLAATYMRGIRFVQVPTTVLSQVDSSVGGKTGVDFNGYKNVVGAFYQPELVFINTNVLKTLPPEQFASGMGEVIKHAIIRDEAYFDFLEEHVESIKALEHNAISEMIRVSCEIKSRVVSEDEKENGIRATLNFGHTIGHAIERLKDFKLLHGECVAIGIVAVSHMSKALGGMDQGDLERIVNLIETYNLPTSTDNLEPDVVYSELFHDKKTMHNKIKFILSKKIGSCYMDDEIDQDIVIDSINKIINE